MARPWRVRFAGAKYHITVRGNGRKTIFHDDEDYQRFLEQMSGALAKDDVVLYAYVLMSNHYHLLIETPRGNIQRFMQRLNTSYGMYHRHKHSSPGHCFQGRYGAKLVEGSDYVLRLTRYIHLNPVKIKAFAETDRTQKLSQLKMYKWSSYPEYAGMRPEGGVVDCTYLELMSRNTHKGNKQEYRKYIEGFLARPDEDLKAALSVSSYAIGDDRFIERVEEELRGIREDKGVYGDIIWPEGSALDAGVVSDCVAAAFGLGISDLASRRYVARTARKVAVELACKHCNISQRQVGEHFGYKGNGSVLKQRQRLAEMRSEDRSLDRKVRRIERSLLNG